MNKTSDKNQYYHVLKSIILPYIIHQFVGDNLLQLQAERMGKKKTTSGRGRRTANPDSIEMDSTSYRLVSKCWALGE